MPESHSAGFLRGLIKGLLPVAATIPWLLILLSGCAGPVSEQSLATISAGTYQLGSSTAERQWGYANSPAVVRSQRWYDRWEKPPEPVVLRSFRIDRWPVTGARYQRFLQTTAHRRPYISEADYHRQGFLAHSYQKVSPYLWQSNQPPEGKSRHPVVLVSREDAVAYCQWRGGRLPTEAEWEASCRGTEQRRFAWSERWDPARLQSDADSTAPVDAHPGGSTPEGVADLLGNVFEWTSTPFDSDRAVLKGCSWDDAPGTCRCGFRHGRPPTSRHILIGFRCVVKE